MASRGVHAGGPGTDARPPYPPRVPFLHAHDPFLALQAAMCTPWLDAPMIALTRTCEGPGLALFAFALALGLERRLRPALVALAWTVAVLLLAGVAVQLLKSAWPSARPLAELGPERVRVLLEPLRGRSLPSGHSAAAGAMAALLTSRFGWRGAPAWLLALLGALSRVYVGAHWTFDVVVGLALGATVSLATVTLALAGTRAASLLRPAWFGAQDEELSA